jgi:hypothetical protein
LVPYYFDFIPIKPSSRDNPVLVGHIKGRGVVDAMAFHSGYYGIAVGYSVDGGEVRWINNGHCLKKWGASISTQNMPVRLLSWIDEFDLQIAVQSPISFKKTQALFL